ncbi:hypothetical protein [Leuconostoc sp. UCMA20149]|uniref:hypothetical protein n=1 Tax=Leuconostoc sp. UCMA20149 TaxID=2583528 RepID=UPI0025B17B70|nr:hypothetical protein [Leuconostoc sp. UCMA20149]MDN2450977.1 hypothetical protein [Leuconostoc sp. UCMA20149]
MTFDEAIEKSRALSLDGTRQIYSDDVIQLINDLRREYELKEPKFEYVIKRSIMSNYQSLQSARESLASGYKIIDKSVLNSGHGEDYIEYILSREITSE